MKVRGIYVKGFENGMSDISLEMRDSDRSLLNVVLLNGLNGSGKTFLLSAIADSWGYSVLSGTKGELPYSCKLLRIDFDMGNEICSLHIRNGNLEKSTTMARVSEISLGEKPFIRNGVVFYSVDRVQSVRNTIENGQGLSDSVCHVYAILYDLYKREIRDSILLIDDWDRGLDVEAAKAFYLQVTKHALSRNNQVILSSSRVPGNYISERSVVKLEGRVNPVDRAISLISMQK